MANLDLGSLRIIAQAAYNHAAARVEGKLAPADCNRLVGELFYPQNLPGDQTRLGGLLVSAIIRLDQALQRKELLGGPALHEDTRRLLVGDVIASAHTQVKDLGWLHKKIDEWYPPDEFAQKIEESTFKMAGGEWKPAANRTFLGAAAPTCPKMFKIEDLLGSFTGEDFRHAYGTLEAVIHGAAFMIETDANQDHPTGSALRNAFYAFNRHMKPLLSGEVAMKGEG